MQIFSKKSKDKRPAFICPKCNTLCKSYIPYYANMYEEFAYGYFIGCDNCDKLSFLLVILPKSLLDV